MKTSWSLYGHYMLKLSYSTHSTIREKYIHSTIRDRNLHLNYHDVIKKSWENAGKYCHFKKKLYFCAIKLLSTHHP